MGGGSPEKKTMRRWEDLNGREEGKTCFLLGPTSVGKKDTVFLLIFNLKEKTVILLREKKNAGIIERQCFTFFKMS